MGLMRLAHIDHLHTDYSHEESRLGREAIETAYALKQLVQTGVRVFFSLKDRERTLDSSPTRSYSR